MSPGRHVTPDELGAQVMRLDQLIGRLDDQIAAHETWHRDLLLRAGEHRQSARLAVWAIIIAAVSAAAALVTALGGMIR